LTDYLFEPGDVARDNRFELLTDPPGGIRHIVVLPNALV